MSRVGMGVGLLLAALQWGGCAEEHTRPTENSSSGSNWLRCQEFADCSQASEAVVCRSDGFCADSRGERIAARAPDAGAPDAQLSLAPNGGEDAGPSVVCAWGTDELLTAAGADVPDRRNCGSYAAYLGSETLAGALNCFDGAIAEGEAVQISFNRCIDCWIRTTYIATETREYYEIVMENDAFGADDQRTATVRSCEDIGSDPTLGPSCSGPATLYECSESRRVARTLPPDPPVEPFKLTDVTRAGASTLLHVYVSNQSFAEPLVDVAVSIDNVQVIVGDFAVEGQHSWHAFEISVPIGTLELYAVTFGTVDAVSFSQQIAVPAERWAVLNYWNDAGDSEGRHFELTMHDMPVSFD